MCVGGGWNGGHGNAGALPVTLCFSTPQTTGPFPAVPFMKQQIHKNVGLYAV